MTTTIGLGERLFATGAEDEKKSGSKRHSSTRETVEAVLSAHSDRPTGTKAASMGSTDT